MESIWNIGTWKTQRCIHLQEIKCIKTVISPSCYEVVDEYALSLLIASHSQSGAAAPEQQRSCSHLPFEDRLAVQESCSCTMAHIARVKGGIFSGNEHFLKIYIHLKYSIFIVVINSIYCYLHKNKPKIYSSIWLLDAKKKEAIASLNGNIHFFVFRERWGISSPNINKEETVLNL